MNNSGQLGLGHQTNLGAPAATPVDLGAGRSARSMSLGPDFTCAVLDNDAFKCWGYGGIGQLGDTTDGIFVSPPSSPIVFP
jgi:alpha-tubulin suppressor-like RCC1 family protein